MAVLVLSRESLFRVTASYAVADGVVALLAGGLLLPLRPTVSWYLWLVVPAIGVLGGVAQDFLRIPGSVQDFFASDPVFYSLIVVAVLGMLWRYRAVRHTSEM
ncbi:MAG TPA: hypothetical protein VH583_12915 [Vicinamibacterales bacterium]